MDRKKLFHMIEWVVALAACAYLAYRLVIFEDYHALWLSLSEMSWRHYLALAACVALMPANMAIEAWRWRTLAFANRRAKVHTTPLNEQATEASALPKNQQISGDPFNMSFSEAQRQVYYSKLAGLITPWRLGEYPSRAILMAQDDEQSGMRDEGLWPKVLSMGAVGSATMTAAIVLAGLCAVGLIGFLGNIGTLLSESYAFLVGAVLLLLVLSLAFAPRLLRRWATVSRRLILISIAQSFVRLSCWCVQLYLVLFALDGLGDLGILGGLGKSAVYYLLVTITPNVPIAEVGVRGMWAIFVFGSMNAAFAGVLLWGINTLLPCLFALPVLVHAPKLREKC